MESIFLHNQKEKITQDAEFPLYKRTGEQKAEVARQTFDFYREFLQTAGYKEFSDVSEAYRLLPDKKIIARREDPRKIFDLFTDQNGYSVKFENERYANCVEWNPHTDGAKNLHNAFMEGMTNINGLVTVIGFLPDTAEDIIAMPDSIQDFYGLDRSGVRSYQGTVQKERVLFITIRIPGHLLPEEYLSESEIEGVDSYLENTKKSKSEPYMVFRTFIPTQQVLH